MKINFPRPTVEVGECIAVWKRVVGHRKEAGPCVEGRKQIMFEGAPWKPSRLSYHLNVASIPRTPPTMKEGLVLHTCDHEWCINPEHLYKGTQSQNLRDTYERHPARRVTQIENAFYRRHTEEAKRKIALNNMFRPRNRRAK